MTRSRRGAASFAAGTAGLREYWGTAVLAAVTGAAALAAVLPVTEFATSAGGIASRLHLGTARPFDAGFLWLRSLGPPELRQAAVTFFSKLLFGVTAGVLVVALLTLLAVFVARASARGPEIAIRRAVGASSRHLLVAQLVEGAVVGAAAVLSGGAIGLMGGRLLGAAWPGSLGAPGGGVSAAAVLVLTAAILLGALLPVAIVRRPARSSAVDPTPLVLVVPAAQLGLSLTVLATGSMLRLGAERIAPPEAAAKGEDQVYDISAAKLPASQRAAGYAELLRRLEADREVTFASLTSPGALVGLGRVALAAGESVFYAVHHLVSADSFQALGLRVVAGRAFADADGWLAPRVAVVSRALAMRLVALGGTISLGYGPEAAHTVIGVVDDVQPVGLGGALAPRFVVYTSILQHPAGSVELLVRGARGKETVAGVRRAIGATLGASASESGPVSEAALFSAEAAPLHWFARVFGAEGWAMLAVATFGTFAVMWLWVTSLLGELGLRRAAGARRRDIMRFVLARAAGVAVAGIAFGAWVGMMVWGVLHTLSVTLPAWDAKAVVWSGLLLALAALAGAFLPAWRAAHTPPAALIEGGEGLQ